MLTFSIVMVLVSGLFLVLGGLLYLVPHQAATGDDLFPTIALHTFGPAFAILFIIALISALFPSADGAMTALTSSFCIDILNLQERSGTEREKKRIRMTVHGCIAVLFLGCILVFHWINNKSIIKVILDMAAYTYGPLLGLFAFGILTRRTLKYPRGVPWVCVLSPIICYFLSRLSPVLLGGYKLGIELLVINGCITFAGLYMLSETRKI
jgi:Na+/pantothenate symporter